MKEIIDKYKREPIAIAVVVGIVLYVLYLLISPYQKCMSLAPEKYYTNKDGEKKITFGWKKHTDRCITNTSY
tara:strand:- start:502 stop:717 length:216 start_codon:yes stop_codon:yes gene_type:complete